MATILALQASVERVTLDLTELATAMENIDYSQHNIIVTNSMKDLKERLSRCTKILG